MDPGNVKTCVKMLWFLCLFLFLHLVLGSPAVNEDLKKTPRFALNLDLPEDERWNPILKHWNVSEYQRVLKEGFSRHLTKEAHVLLDIVAGAIEKYLPSPYAGEIQGIAKYFKVDIGDIVMCNLFYDASVAVGCTSIVAEDSHGNIWHGRNMDMKFTSTLRNWTVVVDFQSKGKTLYTATLFVGQTGVYTGQRPNAFTVSLNERDKGTIAEDIIQILKALISDKTVFTTFQIRDAFTRNDTATFDSALQRLAHHPETTPNYFIIGGTKTIEGAVITRDRSNAVDVWHLDSSKGRWFVLETNYDHWVPAPKDDDRRDIANKAMNEIGPDAINLDTMLKVLSLNLVCNPDTVYTTLMSAAHPKSYVTFVRHALWLILYMDQI